MDKINLAGQRFERLTVISRAENDKAGQVRWNCECDCGNKTTVRGYSLLNGYTKSCGCLNKERSRSAQFVHGMKGTPTYKSWADMKSRCLNKNIPTYKHYGGRGIIICDRWMTFENFYEDMGDRPNDLTLERVDNNKGYSPENCRWATRKEQNRNRRNNVMIKYNGKEQCMKDWAEELGINRCTLGYRLKKYPPQIAFNM